MKISFNEMQRPASALIILAVIAVGASVKAGERIAAIGESALMEVAESPHLHYELEIDGVCVNPADYMLIGSEDTGYEG